MEPILTESGWSTMADVGLGNRVHAPDGTLTAVTFASPVLPDQPRYQARFADGRSTVVGADHLWAVHDMGLRRDVTVTTGEMAGRVVAWAHKTRDYRHYRYSIPMPAGLRRPHVDLPIDPYLLGAWLGDGATDQARITTADPEIVAEFEQRGYPVSKRYVGRSGKATTVAFTGLYVDLRTIGVLGDKHVPDLYLLASHSQRLALLQGLMDTDGCVTQSSASSATRIEFTSTRPQLADAVLFLARSLGWRATLGEGRATLNGRDCGAKYRVSWTSYAGQSPFRLERKSERLRGKPARTPRSSIAKIVAIEPAPDGPVRRIRVDHPSGMFLAGTDLIPTMCSAPCLDDGYGRAA